MITVIYTPIMPFNLVGLEQGIKNTYNKLKEIV
jgi:hypothetical protein